MRGMLPEDLYDLAWAADPRLSPDGTRVAYVAVQVDREANDYRSAVRLVSTDGSDDRQLTAGTKKDAAPRWSPDGRAIAFVSNRDGEHAQLYTIGVDGGEARKLTDLKSSVEDLAWSPDGTRIAFQARVPDPAYGESDDRRRAPRRFRRLQYKLDSVGWTGDRRSHLFVIAAGGGEPEQITDGDFEDTGPAWSPDGSRIAFASARQDDWDVDPIGDIYAVELASGHVERLTSIDGSCSRPSWSPDGSRIAYFYEPGVWDDPHHGQVAVLDLATRERRLLTTSLDRNCAPYFVKREPVWMGDMLVFPVEDGGNTHVYVAPADGSWEPSPVVHGELAVAWHDAVPGHGVYAASTYTSPAEVFYGGVRLSDVSSDFRSGRTLAGAERFTAVSADGSEVDAWIVRPRGFEEGRRYPALLNIHGGPFTQYGTGFFDEFQVYAEAGYVVLYSNPRASAGYSEAWGRAVRGLGDEVGPGWGSRDFEDLMAVVDTALERFDFIDPERIGVIGGSYGGYMTSWIVGHTERFAAACSERAVNNWVSQWGSSDVGPFFKRYAGSFLFEDIEGWLRNSPTTYAANITTPLLILHSEDDLRCPVEQAEHLFATLRMLKRDVEFVRFPAESHELSRSGSPMHRVMRFEVILEWFERYLKAGTS